VLECDLLRRQIVVPKTGVLDPHTPFDQPVDEVRLEIAGPAMAITQSGSRRERHMPAIWRQSTI